MSASDSGSRNLADTNTQPAPSHNDKPAVWSLVMRDMTERDIFGAEKYGTRLQPGNGRDFLLDAYQEALDLVVYLRGAIYERDEIGVVNHSPCSKPAMEINIPPIHPAAAIEVASEIDDSSDRMQAIGQNGNDGEHYGAPDW